MTEIDEKDRAILKVTSVGLPLETEPYHAIAAEVGLPVDEVRERLMLMLDLGIIRRIGAVPNHYRLGVTANGMSVWDVDDEALAELGPQIGALDFVTHCYRRPRHLPDWPYNLFAMVHGATRDDVEAKVARIAELIGPACRAHEILYSKRILKKTGMRFAG
ncbi:MAG: protein nirH [Hyphomicrobiales bacterium]|nr:MAG: protein nirH [Hyphomicrobiales bacterium]